MSKSSRVYNSTRNFWMSRKQAIRGVENCAFAWVEIGVSVRALTLAESVAARHKQARLAEPMPLTEIPGLIFEPSISGNAATRAGYALIRQANALVMA